MTIGDIKNFSEELEDKMKELRFDLDILKVKATEKENDREEMNELIFELQEKLDTFEKKLLDLSKSSPQFWPKVKTVVNRAWEDASYSIKSAKDRYLH